MTATAVSLHERVIATFERLRHSLEGLVAVGLADMNGLPVAFLGPANGKVPATAMAALLLSAAQRATQALGLPAPREVLIGSDEFNILVWPVGERLTLVAILAHEANLGYARIQIQAAGNEIRAAFGGD